VSAAVIAGLALLAVAAGTIGYFIGYDRGYRDAGHVSVKTVTRLRKAGLF
jgi:hypothetical protein